jgi:UDP-GlcNAc:undecaprenyl-phosphate GlcNAc-1-phosphate transferase
MTIQSAIQQAVLFLFLLGLSWLVTGVMRRARIMDVPNERSSHSVRTPKGGGLGIVVAFIAGEIALYLLAASTRLAEPYFIGFIAASLAIAAVSFYDDVRYTPLTLRLAMQIVAASVVLSFGLVVREVWLPHVGRIELGFWAYPVTLVWIVGLTNAMNFMDGMDGLVAGTATVAALFLAAVSFLQGSHFVYLCALALAASTAGFLLHNWPPARIFMGDVGSQFLGFVFAVLALIAAEYDLQRTSFLIVPLLLLGLLFDTGLTLLWRLVRRQPLHLAHRSHLYQLLNRAGWSHLRVSSLHWGFAALHGVGALVLIQLPVNSKILVFAPFVLLQIVYAMLVWRIARQAGLAEFGGAATGQAAPR